MDQNIVQMLIPLEQTKSQFMKLPVALQSRSALIEWSLLVLVMLIFTERTKNILHISKSLAESYLHSCFFYFGF